MSATAMTIGGETTEVTVVRVVEVPWVVDVGDGDGAPHP
jgi:hypothetical protein